MGSDRNHNQGNDLPLGLAKPALRALSNKGLMSLEQISKLSETELKELHGIGPKAVEQLRHALTLRGLSFSKK